MGPGDYVYIGPRTFWLGGSTAHHVRPTRTAHIVTEITEDGVVKTVCGRRMRSLGLKVDSTGDKRVCEICDKGRKGR